VDYGPSLGEPVSRFPFADAYQQAVDGGEHHMRTSSLPYPQSVLDPQSVMEATKSGAGRSKAKL
jgi:hypothetical protein